VALACPGLLNTKLALEPECFTVFSAIRNAEGPLDTFPFPSWGVWLLFMFCLLINRAGMDATKAHQAVGSPSDVDWSITVRQHENYMLPRSGASKAFTPWMLCAEQKPTANVVELPGCSGRNSQVPFDHAVQTDLFFRRFGDNSTQKPFVCERGAKFEGVFPEVSERFGDV